MDNTQLIQEQTDLQTYQQQLQNSILKIDQLQNYLKLLQFFISKTIQKSNYGEMAKKYIQAFDRLIDNYNHQYLTNTNNKLYFLIQQIAISRDQPFFVQRIGVKDRDNKECQGLYFINLVFHKQVKNKKEKKMKKGQNNIIKYRNHYRMHVQIYKQNGIVPFTNPILSKFQKNCTNQIFQTLKDRGFVNHVDGTVVVLNCKKPVYKSIEPRTKTLDQVLELIKMVAQKFLRNMTILLIKEKYCLFCNKHYTFDSNNVMMMPPTMIIWLLKQKNYQDRQERGRILHQVCYLRCYKTSLQSQPRLLISRQSQQSTQQINNQSKNQQQTKNQQQPQNK